MFLITAVFAAPLTASAAGSNTINTYYPAPTGNYDILTANNIGVGTVNAGSNVTVATNVAIGEATGCAGFVGIGLAGDRTCANAHIRSSTADQALYFNRPAGQAIHFRINNGADQMTLEANGNLGINPAGATAQKLDVNGNMILSAANPNLYLGGTTTYLSYPAADTLTFYTNSAEQMRLTSTGLGIGMVPTQKLDVTGNARVSGTTTLATANVSTALSVTSPGTFTAGSTSTLNGATAVNSTLNVTGATTLGGATQVNSTLGVTGVTTLSNNTTVGGTLSTTGLATFNAGVTIAGGALNVAVGTTTLSGSVGVGAAPNASYRLYVLGDMGVDGDIYNLSGGYYYGAPSDERLKENITPITDALNKVRALRGVTFTWKKDKKRSLGVIAQDVEKVFPELVFTDKKGIKHVFMENLVGALIEAIKQQQNQIDALKKDLAELRKKMNDRH